MRLSLVFLLGLMLSLSSLVNGAPLSGQEIADAMRNARVSDGFSLRMNVAVIEASGKRHEPFKLSVVGQRTRHHQRLLLRGISPISIQQQRIAAEIRAGEITAVSYADAPNSRITPIAANQQIFDSGLVLWDMFAPWWDWPDQRVLGAAKIRGQECIILSSAGNPNAGIQTVISCIDVTQKVALKTEIFGEHQKLLRVTEVLSTLRLESGAVSAKKIQLRDARNTITESEIYSGDENYEVNDALFTSLDSAEKH